MNTKKVLVIGAGISGLSAAVELKSRGFDVTILEKQSRAGGVIGTHSENGFKAESGSNSAMVNSQKTLDFLKKIGLADKIRESNKVAKKRFFMRYGKVRAVPMGPISLLFTRLFTFLGKIRLFCEPLVSKTPPDSDPSIAEFTRRRLGEDVLDYAINPFMAGVYGGNPQKLSIKHAFTPFWNLEQKYGSIICGAIKSMKAKKAAGNFFKPLMISFDGGMQTMTDSMANYLGDNLKPNAKVLSVDSNGDGWEVSWADEFEEVCDFYNALIIAVPAPDIEKLPLSGMLSAALEPLSKIKYAPVTTFTLGFDRRDVAHKLDGFGALTPEKENMNILGSLFVSSIFSDRAPKGFVTLTNYIGGMRHPELAPLAQDKILEIVMADIKKMLGVSTRPIFQKIFYWENAIPQYEVGYQDFLDVIESAENTYTSFALIGAYRGGVGVSSCIENGVAAADRIADSLQ